MEKTATLNLRVNPSVKKKAEEVLKALGIPVSTAVDMFLTQVGLTGGIPFQIVLPHAPAAVDARVMTADELHARLDQGYQDMLAGKVQDADSAFESFRKAHTE